MVVSDIIEMQVVLRKEFSTLVMHESFQETGQMLWEQGRTN